MSRKGNYGDNALAESFFKTIKTELVYRNRYEDKNQAAVSIFEWIETWQTEIDDIRLWGIEPSWNLNN